METERIKTAVEFLTDGQSFNVCDLRLDIGNNTLSITGWTLYANIENITKSQSLRELEDVKTLFNKMIDSSAELKAFVADKKVEYSLCYDDYGKGSIIICTEKDGILKWHMKL